MNCVLGLDGGGTKTECVVLNEVGAIVARATGPPSNPTRIGFPAALAAIQETCASAIGSTRIKFEVLALCAGLAGTGLPENRDQMRQFLAQRFPTAIVDVRMDIELPLAAMPPGPAIVLIVGTGSAAIGRNIAGLVDRGGYLFVSGVDLEVRAKVAHELGWRPIPELLEQIHDGDPDLRGGWPLEWWGLEPLNRRRRDWQLRYAAAFQSIQAIE